MRPAFTHIATSCLALAVAHVSLAAEWQFVKGPLATRWTKEVGPDNALPEYPRPQMSRPDWVNLNGLWQYKIQPANHDTPSSWDGEILVPYPIESALSGVMKAVKPNERLWYRRTFERPPMPDGGRVLLHFGAVDWQCQVWVNGKEVGQHTGGYDPFTFDVTDSLEERENELVVAVTDPTDQGYQPRGKQVLQPNGIWYTAVTGIWQTAWLESVPANYIRSLKITPDVDRGVAKIAVDAGQGRVRVTASDGGDEVAKIEGAAGETLELPISNAKLWSPDSPHLYDLKVELVADGEAVDTVASYVGMRKIEVKKDDAGLNRLWLNGKVLFQYGPLDQGWWPDGLYTPPTDEALKYDIQMTKQLGMNMARKHVKVELPRWYYWCDRLGLLVWQDMPSTNVDDAANSKKNFRDELQRMVQALHNHPSIVMWVPFNEGWGQHDTEEVVAWLEKLDPTRPVNEASGWHNRGSGTVSDMHNYPGPGMRPVEDKRVIVLGEFGGLGMPVKGHTWQDEANWGYVSYQTTEELTEAYVGLLTAMRPLVAEGLSAAVYTQTSDVEIEVNGLMTYDREIVKMNLDRIREAAKLLYEPAGKLAMLVPTSEQEGQDWRYVTSAPTGTWTTVDFDDSQWNSGQAGFGAEGTPGAVVRSTWNGRDIWLRRIFEIDSVPEGVVLLRVHHDEDAEIFLNGVRIARLRGYTSGYQWQPAESNVRAAVRPGKNSLAVHCRQTTGGQYIDVGLAVMPTAGK